MEKEIGWYHSFYTDFTNIFNKNRPVVVYKENFNKETSGFQLAENPHFNALLSQAPGIVCVFNHHTMKYEYFSINVSDILGYTPEDFIEGGLSFGLSTFHPDHAPIFSTQILPTLLEYCNKYAPNDEVKDLRFSYNFLVRKKSGEYIWCLQQMNIVETDENGYPFIDLIFMTDIDSMKKDNHVNFTISKKSPQGYLPIFMAVYPTGEESELTERELQVLKLISEGNKSPQISEILNISEHTVATHRRNIMGKMNAKNAMEMIKIAFSRGML